MILYKIAAQKPLLTKKMKATRLALAKKSTTTGKLDRGRLGLSSVSQAWA
jgi:hypothetical protein